MGIKKETAAMRAKMVNAAGVDLEFPTGSVKGIPGFETQVLYKGEESLYEVEKQNFSFQLLSSDWLDNELTTGMQFTMDDETFQFTFEVVGTQPDLTGWLIVKVIFISKETL